MSKTNRNPLLAAINAPDAKPSRRAIKPEEQAAALHHIQENGFSLIGVADALGYNLAGLCRTLMEQDRVMTIETLDELADFVAGYYDERITSRGDEYSTRAILNAYDAYVHDPLTGRGLGVFTDDMLADIRGSHAMTKEPLPAGWEAFWMSNDIPVSGPDTSLNEREELAAQLSKSAMPVKTYATANVFNWRFTHLASIPR